MAQDLGSIEFTVKPDERAWMDVQRRGGREAGRAIVSTMRASLSRVGSAVVGSAAGGRARSVFDLAVAGAAGKGAGAARAAAGGAAGAAGRAAGAGAGIFNTGAVGAGAAAGAAGGPHGILIGALIAAAVAALVAAVALAVKTLRRWSSALEAETKRLASVSPILAGVAARNLVGRVRRDFSRAGFLGPLLADTEMRKERIRNLLAPVKNAIDLLKAGAVAAATRSMEVFAQIIVLASQELIRWLQVVNTFIFTVLQGISFLLGLLPFGSGAGLSIMVDDIAHNIITTNTTLQRMSDHIQDLVQRSSGQEINRMMMRGLEELTVGKWQFPVGVGSRMGRGGVS